MLFFPVQEFHNDESNGTESNKDERWGGGGEEVTLIDETIGVCAEGFKIKWSQKKSERKLLGNIDGDEDGSPDERGSEKGKVDGQKNHPGLAAKDSSRLLKRGRDCLKSR